RPAGAEKQISILVALLILAATVAAGACLEWFVDSERHGWGWKLGLRIAWGCCVVALLAIFLTRVTIFGWSFRRYFRWQPDGAPHAEMPRRPTTAPWTKGGKMSFATTVTLVSVTGAFSLTILVLYVLMDVVGWWVFWLVCMILGIVWWVTCIVMVLTRIAI